MRIAPLALLAAPLFVATAARAKEPPHPLVSVDASACATLRVEELRRIVGVELGAQLTDASDPGNTTIVTLACATGRIEITVEDPITGKHLRRVLDLQSSDSRATPRLVALAVVELVTASWTELEVTPVPIVPAAGPKPDPTSVRAARSAAVARLSREFRTPPERSDDHDLANEHPLRAAAMTTFRAMPSYDGTLWGGGVQIGEDRFRLLGWRADGLFEQGTLHAYGGGLRVSTFTVSGGIAAYGTLGPLTLRGGLGFRVGVAQVGGTALPNANLGSTSRTVLAPWGWPEIEASVTVAVWGSLLVELGGDGGYTILPIASGSSSFDSVEVRGFWFGGRLGVGVAL